MLNYVKVYNCVIYMLSAESQTHLAVCNCVLINKNIWMSVKQGFATGTATSDRPYNAAMNSYILWLPKNFCQ